MLTPLQRFGVKRWSPPGRLARKRAPKPARSALFPPCSYCFGNHALTTTCLDAASTPEQRGWHGPR